MSQAELAGALGMTQGNVSFYENGQTIPPDVGAKIIEYARSRGHVITFDDLYAPLIQPASTTAAP